MNGWRKSTYSYANGNCVEVAWRKASGSFANGDRIEVGWQKAQAGNGHSQCVEAGTGACGMVHVRDSKDPGGPVLAFTRARWDAFIQGVKNGELDGTHAGRRGQP